jgi:hypothetical protein
VRALVVYESMFGNTQTIANAVAAGLTHHLKVEVVEVGKAPAVIEDDVGLLVVGGPTHGFGLTRPSSRKSAAEQADGPVVSKGIGVREWLETVRGPSGLAAVAFDTRVPKVPGSAARKAQKRLRRLGFRRVAEAESFFVTGTKGPLVDAEAERARTWGERLASMAGAAPAGQGTAA